MMINDTEAIVVETPTGPMRTQVARPVEPGRYPGLILYSEIFQITKPIARMAAQLAGNGFVVLVPEVYHEYEAQGCVLAYDEAGAARGNELKTTKPVASFDSDTRALIDSFKTLPYFGGKIGAMGICMGGHLAFRAAMEPEVAAATCFYATDIHKRGLGAGMHDDSLDRINEIKGELLMIFGRQDPHVPREGRRIIYDALADADTNFTWHEFNGAHAFMRDEGPRYDPALAHLCFEMAIELFKRRLTARKIG
jgi:carboxymethylenebutenolidase